jgi:hypothetical protein
MTKARLARSTSRHRAPSRRDITKPALFDLNEQVRDIVAPLELELRHAELDEFVPHLVDIMWTFVEALARAQGYTDADWDAAERSFRHPRGAVLTEKMPAAWGRVEMGHVSRGASHYKRNGNCRQREQCSSREDGLELP